MSIKKRLLIVAGFAALALGIIGVFLPILPTTPFVLMASGCFAGSSPRLYRRLSNARYIGPFIRNYRTKSGVSRKDKIRALAFLWVMLAIPALSMKTMQTWIICMVVGVSVSAHILLLKSEEKKP